MALATQRPRSRWPLGWKIEYLPGALKDLKKLDKQVAREITAYLRDLASTGFPEKQGKPLSGKLAGLRRYRWRDWRVVTRLDHENFIILAVAVGHRSRIYE
ncbi:type II toxin-antitoxin system RelE family toxin [Actinobaculum suis]|uniref:type II toxin-antitoxin system RelE family toxin n=1 Tax=Actinobaculum suis TaxID=1657 RepID=UPI000943AE3F